MTTQVVSVKGVVSEDYNNEYLYDSYHEVKEVSNKAADMNLNDGVNPMPTPLFTFEVSI